MTSQLQPTLDDSRTNRSFEELMWAMSRPGLVRILPSLGFASIAESLLDRECSFAVLGDREFSGSISRTGARSVPASEADYVFGIANTREAASQFINLRTGTLEYPDHAATLILPATIGFGSRLTLTGPGIRESVTVAVDGIDPCLWEIRARSIRYPLGWDVYLVDGDRVIGLPRSTKIEVL